jgi:hypothetical protein
MRHLLFLDLKDLVTEVELPSDVRGQVTAARVITWNMEGQPEIPLGLEGRTTCFYMQLKFEGCLETQSITHGARPDMFPLPLRSFDDWAPTTLSLPIPLRASTSTWSRRFKVSMWGEGISPAPFVPMTLAGTLRLLLWIELDTTE